MPYVWTLSQEQSDHLLMRSCLLPFLGQPLYEHVCNALPAFMEDVPTTFDHQLKQKHQLHWLVGHFYKGNHRGYYCATEQCKTTLVGVFTKLSTTRLPVLTAQFQLCHWTLIRPMKSATLKCHRLKSIFTFANIIWDT